MHCCLGSIKLYVRFINLKIIKFIKFTQSPTLLTRPMVPMLNKSLDFGLTSLVLVTEIVHACKTQLMLCACQTPLYMMRCQDKQLSFSHFTHLEALLFLQRHQVILFLLTSIPSMDITEKKKKHLRLIVAAVSTVAICHMNNKYVVDGRLPNSHDADYDKVVEKISKMKEQKQLLFTRMYRLSPMSFDKVLVIIELLSFQTYCCSRTWSSLF